MVTIQDRRTDWPGSNWQSTDIVGKLFEDKPLGIDFVSWLIELANWNGDMWYKFTGQIDSVINLPENHMEFYDNDRIAKIQGINKAAREGDYLQRLSESFSDGSTGRNLVYLLFNKGETEESYRERQGVPSLMSQIVFEYLPQLHPDTKLPYALGQWLAGVHSNINIDGPIQKEDIINTLNDTAIPSHIRQQIVQKLADYHINNETLESVMEGYKIFGESVGNDLRNRIFPLFLSGLVDEDMFKTYKEDLIQLYAQADNNTLIQAEQENGYKESRGRFAFFSKIFSYLPRISEHKAPETTAPIITLEDRVDGAERRIEIIRDIVMELFPTITDDLKVIRELRSYDQSVPDGLLDRWGDFNPSGWNEDALNLDISTLSIETLEGYLSDIRSLRSLPEFKYHEKLRFGRGGLTAPYFAFGNVLKWEREPFLDHLKLLQTAPLNDRVAKDILKGISLSYGNLSWVLETQTPIEDLSAFTEFMDVLNTNNLPRYGIQFPSSTKSAEMVKHITDVLRQDPDYAREMLIPPRLAALSIQRGVIDLHTGIGEDGNLRLTWTNPPDSIRWFVIQYYNDHKHELADAEIALVSRVDPYAEGLTPMDKEIRNDRIRRKYVDGNFPDISGNSVMIELRESGVYVNGVSYEGQKEHCDRKMSIDPPRELLKRVAEYTDPFVDTQVVPEEYAEPGDLYQNLVEQTRTILRVNAATHLVYTSLARPQEEKGTQYIVGLDREGENIIYAIAVNGRELSIDRDGERYQGVEAFSILRRDDVGRFTPSNQGEMLKQLTRPPELYAKAILAGLEALSLERPV